MRRITFFNALLLTLALTLGACTNQERGGTDATEPVQAEVVDGVQVVNITAGLEGYRPASVQLQPGVPARLVFTRTADSACLEQVQVPDFGIAKTDLPLGEPVAIEFTPQEAGTFTFICGMDMQTGTIAVRS